MANSVKIYTYESIMPPDPEQHPKGRVIRTTAMHDAGMDFQWCCRPMDMEPIKGAIALKASTYNAFYNKNECRWCGTRWDLIETTDGNNETFYEYREAEVITAPVNPEPLTHDEPAVPMPFKLGIACPHCKTDKGRMFRAVDGNFMCTHCSFGRTSTIKYRMEKGHCPACHAGVLVKRDDNSGIVKCYECKYEGRLS